MRCSVEIGSFNPPGAFAPMKRWQDYLSQLQRWRQQMPEADHPLLDLEISSAQDHLKFLEKHHSGAFVRPQRRPNR